MLKGLGAILISLLLAGMVLSGCAHTMSAIEHREMTVTAKMSDTIFIDPKILATNNKVFLKVTNTSDMQEIDFEPQLKNKLASKGLTLVTDPSQAGYIIQANVLYMDYEKEGMTADGMLAGGFGGAIAGSKIGSGWRANTAGAVAGAAIGSVVGGLVASAIKVETFCGVVDIQIQEKVEGGVKGKMVTDASQGSATKLQTEREIKSEFQTYRTRIVAKATQTNIDKKEAARVLSAKLADQIGGLF